MAIETADLDDAIVRVACDHSDDQRVDRLFERIVTEQRRLDVLVNNARGGYENMVEDDRFAADGAVSARSHRERLAGGSAEVPR